MKPAAAPTAAAPAATGAKTTTKAFVAAATDGKSKIFTSTMWCILFPGILLFILYLVQMLVGFSAAGYVGQMAKYNETLPGPTQTPVHPQFDELSKCCSAVAVFALLLDLVMLAVFLPYIKNFWNRCLTIKKVAHWIGIGLGTFFFIGYLISNIYECAVVFGPTGTSMHEIVKQFPDTHPLKGTFDSAAAVGNIFITMIVFIVLTPGFFFLYYSVPLFHALMSRWTTAVKAKIAPSKTAPPVPPTTKNPAGPSTGAGLLRWAELSLSNFSGNPFVSTAPSTAAASV